MNDSPQYVFGDNRREREHDRLLAVQREFDPETFRLLDRLPLERGWSCLEIGCGAGSVLHELARRVGPTGRVVGIDLDPRFVQASGTVEVRQGDVSSADLGTEQFDLVHARFVLIHVPLREEALTRMIRALKPGGWLVLEEPDFLPAGPAIDRPPVRDVVARVYEAIRRMYDAAGAEANLGRRLPGWLHDRGLVDVSAEAVTALWRGGSGRARLRGQSLEALRPRLLATDVTSNEDLDCFLRLTEDPAVWAFDYSTISAWARKKRQDDSPTS